MLFSLLVIETKRCVFLGTGGEYALNYSSDDDPSSLVVAEGQTARFGTKTVRVCSGLIVLTYCT